MLLRRLTVDDESALRRALPTWDGNSGFTMRTLWEDELSISEYVQRLENRERGIDLPPNFVAESFLHAFEAMKSLEPCRFATGSQNTC